MSMGRLLREGRGAQLSGLNMASFSSSGWQNGVCVRRYGGLDRRYLARIGRVAALVVNFGSKKQQQKGSKKKAGGDPPSFIIA